MGGWKWSDSSPKLFTADGVEWQKYQGNPVLSVGDPGTWDDATVYHPKIAFDGRKYFMWYAGSDGNYVKGGLGTSEDGIVWEK